MAARQPHKLNNVRFEYVTPLPILSEKTGK
jgi:hypothetical protein